MKNLFYFLICVFLLIIICLLFQQKLFIHVEAATTTPQILINEIMYNPAGADDNHEWLEIYNFSTSTSYIIDDNWRFNDGSSHQLEIILGDNIISPEEYIVLADNDQIFLQDYPEFNGTLVDTVTSLNNTADTLSFSIDSGQTFFATITYQALSKTDDTGDSLSRVEFNDDWQAASSTPGSLNLFIQATSTPTTTDSLIDGTPTSTATGTVEVIDDGQSPSSTDEVIQDNQTIVYSNQIIINEFLPNPAGSDNEDEWIELYNRSATSTDLAGWILGDASTKRYEISAEDFSSTFIEAFGYFVVYRSESGISLNNTGDEIKLFQPDENLLDQIEYADTAKDNYAYAKNGGSWSWTIQPTPGQANVIQQESSSSATTVIINQSTTSSATTEEPKIDYKPENYKGLLISELLPNPAGSDATEWLELYNNSSSTLNLFGFQLDDEEGGSRPYSFGATSTIEAFSYLIINKSDSKISFNNSTDSARLIDPKGEIFLEVEYDSVKEGKSYAYNFEDEEWYWSEQPTPGEKNISPATLTESLFNASAEEVNESFLKTEFPLVDLLGVKYLEKGDKVSVVGLVAVSPQILGKNIIYVVDPANSLIGSQLYSSSGHFNELQVGDLIEVKGKISFSQDEARVLADKNELVIILGQAELPPAQNITIDELNDDLVGGLFQISGEIVERRGSNLYLDDGTGELRVYIKKESGIKPADIEEGWQITVSGILSLTSSGYRLLPRSSEDINIGEVLGAVEENFSTSSEVIIMPSENNESQLLKYFLLAGGSVFLIVIALFIKLKFIKSKTRF